MALENQVCSLMTEADVEYCRAQYDLSADFIKGMTDDDWTDFLGCEKVDLPYYLIDEARWDEVEYDIESLFENYDDGDVPLFDEDVLYGNKPSEKELDLWESAFGKTHWNRGVTTITPAKPKAKPAPKVIPHYFVVVK